MEQYNIKTVMIFLFIMSALAFVLLAVIFKVSWALNIIVCLGGLGFVFSSWQFAKTFTEKDKQKYKYRNIKQN